MDKLCEYLDYEQLTEEFVNRGIIVTNRDFAKEVLNAVPFKHLNGTRKSISKVVDQQMSLEFLYSMHLARQNLHHILLKNILHVEQHLKILLSHMVAQRYGVHTDRLIPLNKSPNDYLSTIHYSNKAGSRHNTIRKIKEAINAAPKRSSLCKYRETKSNIPPWILLENLPLGLVIPWYEILLHEDKDSISREIFLSAPSKISDMERLELTLKALKILKEYRNVFAHSNRFEDGFARNELPRTPMKIEYCGIFYEDDLYDGNVGKNDFMALVSILCMLLPNRFHINALYADLEYLVTPYLGLDRELFGGNIFDLLGIPQDVLARIEKYLHDYLLIS